MASVRERIQQNVLAAIAALPGLAGGVERNRDAEPVLLPAATLIDRGDIPVSQTHSSITRMMRLEVLFDMNGDAGEGLATAIDAWQIKAHVALLTDTQWGGLAEDTTLGALDLDLVEGADVREGCFRFALDIQFTIRRLDPSAQ